MRRRFPADLFAAFFGPVIMILVAVAVGSVTFYADRLGGTRAAYVAAAAVVAVILCYPSF